MHARRGNARRMLVVAAVVAIAATAIPSASATTGANALGKPPRFHVAAARAKPFLGAYRMVNQSHSLIGSAIRSGYNSYGYLQGEISVYTYYQGHPESFVASLYEYRYRAGKMLIDLWTPDVGSAKMGDLTLRRVGRQLRGTLHFDQTDHSVVYAPVPAAQADASYRRAGLIEGSGTPTGAGLFSTAVTIADVLG